MEISEKDFVTVEEAAKMLSCSVFSVRKLCREGKIKAFKKLKRWYIFKVDITTYIKSNTNNNK